MKNQPSTQIDTKPDHGKQEKKASLLEMLVCCVLGHEWTCASREGISPTAEQVSRGTAGMNEYYRIYCKRCPSTYKLETSVVKS